MVNHFFHSHKKWKHSLETRASAIIARVKNKHVCIHEIIQLIIMKMKTKMKVDSRKCGINRPRCRHGGKYSKYMQRLSMMMLICIKHYLSNI